MFKIHFLSISHLQKIHFSIQYIQSLLSYPLFAMHKVLIVEDDAGIVTSLSLYLERSGFAVASCRTGSDAVSTWETEQPNIVILDLNLPGRKGMDVCADIRGRSETPIIILSARDDEEDKVHALELGADDYIEKPFSPRELVARIGSVLKRSHQKNTPEENVPLGVLRHGRIALDLDGYELLIDDVPVKTTKTEFEIIHYLVDHPNIVVRREDLMHDIMGYEHYLYDRTIDTHMKNLRRKIGMTCTIETIRGIGYKLH